MALWSGRFSDSVAKDAEAFGASLFVDVNIALEDVQQSLAHVQMLGAQGILSSEDAQAIQEGLRSIAEQIKAGNFAYDSADEDIHMAIEKALINMIGPVGGKLHTGRSRNDQVATDLHLFAKSAAAKLIVSAKELLGTYVSLAEDNQSAIIPGYTHLQHAQPVLFSHHMLAYAWMLKRDIARILLAQEHADINPLGSAALAGTSYPLDRELTTKLLGLSAATQNSLDAVSDRDFILDLIYACSTIMMHLSKLSEEIILWSSTEFDFIRLSDSYSTGSSIMPQKKNPDFAELIRGKTGRVYGDLMSLLTTLKALPLAYNKDLQECKEPLFDAFNTANTCMNIMSSMLSTMTLKKDKMLAACSHGFLAATDVADFLTKAGLSFREAHKIVGEIVLYCEQKGIELEQLTNEELAQHHPLLEKLKLSELSPAALVEARSSLGGTATSQVKAQISELHVFLASLG